MLVETHDFFQTVESLNGIVMIDLPVTRDELMSFVLHKGLHACVVDDTLDLMRSLGFVVS